MTHNLIAMILIQAIPILFAITVHEAAHGWMANKLGDPTAKLLGRLTLNPIKHIDPVGTILIPGMLILLQAPFLFGWAKPVPVNGNYLRKPRRDMALVAAAGPISNLLMAIFWGLVAKIAMMNSSNLAHGFYLMGQAGISINLILMLLNAIPIPPLDGSRVVASIVSPKVADFLHRVEPYGFIILVILLATGILGKFLFPIFHALYRLISITLGI